MLVDSHAHLHDWKDEEIPPLLETARQAGVEVVVSVGTMPDTSRQAIQHAKDYPHVFAGVGIHPRWVTEENRDEWVEATEALARSEKVCVIGEIGLDMVLNPDNFEHQVVVYKSMVRLAQEVNLPINIHGGRAHDVHLSILRELGIPAKGGIIHSFMGTMEELKGYLDLGISVSFGFQVLKKVPGYEDIVRKVPGGRMVLETDSNLESVLVPPPVPARLAEVAQDVAALRGMSLAEVEETTTENLERMYGSLR